MNSNVLPSSYELYSHTKICGIYKITSPSGRIYIGSSKNIYKRWYRYGHESIKNQIKLSNSIQKYGWASHTFEILEECETNKLYSLERAWGDFYSVITTGLNCQLPGKESIKPCISEETRQKIRIKATGRVVSEETRNKLSLAKKGKKLSLEHVEKIRNNSKGKKMSEEAREKIILNLSKIILDTSTGVFYNSVKEAANYFNINYSTLRSMLQGKNKNKTNLIYA